MGMAVKFILRWDLTQGTERNKEYFGIWEGCDENMEEKQRKTGDTGAPWIQFQTPGPGKVLKCPDVVNENVRQQWGRIWWLLRQRRKQLRSQWGSLVCTTEHQRVEAPGSKKDTVLWAEYSRSQNSGQCRTIQKLTRTVGLYLGERKIGQETAVVISAFYS